MPISVLQSATNGTGGANAATFGSDVVSGSGLFACFGYAENGTHASSVTDTVGTTYTKVAQKIGSGTTGSVEIWFGTAPTGGANTVTVHYPSGKSTRVLILIEADPTTGKSFAADQNAGNADSGTSHSCGSITTTADDELILAIATCAFTTTFNTFEAGYTRQQTSPANSLCLAKVSSAIETTSATFNSTVSRSMTECIASFLLVDASPPSPVRETQVVQSLVVATPPSPLRETQVVQGLTVQGTVGLRETQVVRTLIVSPIIPPTPPPPGCPAIVEIAPVTGSDGCAPADLVE